MSCKYFDWAATSLPDEQILKDALLKSFEYSANPSSSHNEGKKANDVLQKSREKIASVLKIDKNNIIFTSGGTESDYLPMLSLLQRTIKGSILISAVEHPAITKQAEMMTKCGWKVIKVLPRKDGIIYPEDIVKKIEHDTALVCVMATNNETGALMPIYEIADAIAKNSEGKKKPKFHVDAVQGIGKIPLNISHPGIDSVAISGHKIMGPRGIGLLYMKNKQEPFIRGGSQENGFRPGTENIFGAIALANCIEKYADNDYIQQQNILQQKKLDKFIENLLTLNKVSIIPENRLTEKQKYSPWVLQVAFERIPGEVMVRALSEKGFSISTGSACSAKKQSRPILDAMNVSKDVSSTAVRFSFGHKNDEKDFEDLFEALKEIRNRFK